MTQIILTIEDGFKEKFFSILEVMKDKVKIEKQQEIFEFVDKTEQEKIVSGLKEAIDEFNSNKLQTKTKTLRNLIDEL